MQRSCRLASQDISLLKSLLSGRRPHLISFQLLRSQWRQASLEEALGLLLPLHPSQLLFQRLLLLQCHVVLLVLQHDSLLVSLLQLLLMSLVLRLLLASQRDLESTLLLLLVLCHAVLLLLQHGSVLLLREGRD